jgi:hypothetical protein
MADVRGSLPLSYVHKKHWVAWIQFLDEEKEVFWPRYADCTTGPPLALLEPNSRPMPDPEHMCSLEMAKMIASGKMKAHELKLLHLAERKADCDSSSGDDESEDRTEWYDETCSSVDSIYSDVTNFDNFDQEMAELLKQFEHDDKV